MNLSKDGTNQLPKAGFDWIALKIIFQGRKGLNLPLFSNFDTYCPFIQNMFGLAHFHIFLYINQLLNKVLLKCIASFSISGVILVMFSNFNGVDSFWTLFSRSERSNFLFFVIYLGQYLRNGACCDQCLCEAHIQSHIWYFGLPCDLWPWITFNGQIKVTDLSRVCVS